MSYERVASLDELWEGDLFAAEARGVPVLLIRLGDTVRAYVDRCAHKGVRLSEGHLRGTRLICPAHLWEYDLSEGQGINPRTARLRALPVRIDDDGSIAVELPATAEDP